MCTVLCEEAAAFDLSMSGEEREILVGNEKNPPNGVTPEKGTYAFINILDQEY